MTSKKRCGYQLSLRTRKSICCYSPYNIANSPSSTKIVKWQNKSRTKNIEMSGRDNIFQYVFNCIIIDLT